MESILLDIIAALQADPGTPRLTDVQTQAIVRAHNVGRDARHHFAKKQLLPFYQRTKASDPERWRTWRIGPALETRLLATLQVKPRRTASGVATITVITKPAPCANACLYCPNDIRMPKSYLSNEPACQRAERNFFDPYLQVISRARALHEMGHNIDKIELIVLGGTWCDYPESYQRWFVTELFRACNDIEAELTAAEITMAPGTTGPAGATGTPQANRATQTADSTEPAKSARTVQAESTTHPDPSTRLFQEDSGAQRRRNAYQLAGLTSDDAALEQTASALQHRVNAGELTYNEAIAQLYSASEAWRTVSKTQTATSDELHAAQTANEDAKNRVVGFVVETRPDTITPARLALLRDLGCTKVQMGIQSMDPSVLSSNNRTTAPETTERALSLVRLFGFKIHTHFMVNLAGATPNRDKADFQTFIDNPATTPDEVKLYPCALVDGTGLCELYRTGTWRPYTEGELIDVLSADVLATPEYCRISRMIRDIGADDILVGNKKTNLRQMVDQALKAAEHGPIREIRQREIKTDDFDPATLTLRDVEYETAVSTEHFLEWVTPENRIAGFLRLSLPKPEAIDAIRRDLLDGNPADPDSPARQTRTDKVSSPASQTPSAVVSSPAVQAALALRPDAAMIREVHVYGRAANIGASVEGAQHTGLGKQLITRAEEIARGDGRAQLNVISSIGTRRYYAARGFAQVGLYQQKLL